MEQVLAALPCLSFLAALYFSKAFFGFPRFAARGVFAAGAVNFFFGRGSFFLQAHGGRGFPGKVAAVGRGAVAVFLQNFFGVFLSSARVALGFTGKVAAVGRGAALKIFAAHFKFFRGRKKFARRILRGFGADSRDKFWTAQKFSHKR